MARGGCWLQDEACDVNEGFKRLEGFKGLEILGLANGRLGCP